MPVKIASAKATCVNVPAEAPVTRKPATAQVVVVVVRVADGTSGVGIARGNWGRTAVRALVNDALAPFLLGRDPIDTEAIWSAAARDMPNIFQARTGVVAQAMSAVDQALWDLKGKLLGEPVYRLLGGARSDIDVYTTFGVRSLDRKQLAAAARDYVNAGHTSLKMQTVAVDGAQDIKEDAIRVGLVRDAVGGDVRLMFDGNCNFDLPTASRLAQSLEPFQLTFFDDPIVARDTPAMAELRRRTTVPLATRAPYDNIWSARDMIDAGAVDVVQVNVLDGGGFSECLKVAHLAEMHHLPIAVGGAHYVPNAHLIAGVSNGMIAEYHLIKNAIWDELLTGFPVPANGKLRMSANPGIGWTLNEAVLQRLAERGG